MYLEESLTAGKKAETLFAKDLGKKREVFSKDFDSKYFSNLRVTSYGQPTALIPPEMPHFLKGTKMCFITIPGVGNHILTSDDYKTDLTGRTKGRVCNTQPETKAAGS